MGLLKNLAMPRRPLSYKSPAHRIHRDIQPIVSAIKFGKYRIAQERLHNLSLSLELTRWETVVVIDLIQSKCADLGYHLSRK